MANQVEITITADPTNAEAGLKKVKSGFESMKDSIVKNRKAIGLGITAMGAGIEGLAQKQAPLTEATRKLSNQTGFSEDAIRDMATELSNATFPLDEALALMEQGSKQGLASAEALKKYAKFWDTVGDATGLSSKQLANSAAALKSVGVAAGEEGRLLGAFGLISRETSGDVGEFLQFVERMSSDLGTMGISVDDAAVAMAALEGKGIKGRAAMTEFREAVADVESGMDAASKQISKSEEANVKLAEALADGKISQAEYNEEVAINNEGIKAQRDVMEELSKGGLGPLLEQLGLTEAETEKYRESLGKLDGAMAEDAEALASTKTVMDKLKSSMGDLVFANSAVIEKASALAPIFMAAGPVIAGFGPIMTTSMTIAGTAVKGFSTAVKLAMGPAGLALLAVTAMIAIGVLLWQNWDTVKEKAIKIFKKIQDVLDILKATFTKVFNWIRTIVVNVFTKITDIYHSKLGWLLPAGPLVKAILFLKDNWDTIWNGIKATFKTVTDALISTFRTVKSTVLGIWDGMVSGIKSAIDAIMPTINRVIGAASRVGGAIRSATTLGGVGGVIRGGVGGVIRGIFGREHGGPVAAGQPVIVGERRPELFVPRTSGTILPRITGASGGGAGMTVNLVINGDINGMDDFEQKVTSVIRDAVLGGGFSGVLARA